MRLTPEQKAEVERQRHENPSARGVRIEFTPEQREEYRRLVAIEMAGMEANKAYARKLVRAAEEPGFSGDLRRAIRASRRRPDQLAAEIGVDPELFDRFCTGEADLPTPALDRLINELGLKLVAEVR